MNVNEATQEQKLDDFLQYNISNTIKELEAKTKTGELNLNEIL